MQDMLFAACCEKRNLLPKCCLNSSAMRNVLFSGVRRKRNHRSSTQSCLHLAVPGRHP
jgi:hypothetical protein